MVFVLLGPIGFFAPAFLWIIPLVEIVTRRRAIIGALENDKLSLLWKNGFLLAVPLYGLITVLWSINPLNAAGTALKVFAFIALGGILISVVKDNYTAPMRDRLFTWVACGLIAAELLVLTDILMGGVVSTLLGQDRFADIVYSRGAAIAALTLLPIAVALARRANWPVFAAFVALGLVTIILLSNNSAKLAITASVVVYALVWWNKRLFWAVLALPILYILIVPAFSQLKLDNRELCAVKEVKTTAAHRIVIWQFAAEMALRKPLTGWGMGSSRAIPGGSEVVSIAKCYDPWQKKMTDYRAERIPLHPHNSGLQLWLELGALGVVIAVGAILHLLRRTRGNTPAARKNSPLVAAAFTSAFFIYSISFGIWQSWLISTTIILFILTTLSRELGAPNEQRHDIG